MVQKFKSKKKQKQKKVQCFYCKVNFWCFLSWINRRKKLYCSVECLNKDIESNKKIVEINYCKNEFCNKKLNKDQKKFCGKICLGYFRSKKYKLDLKIKNEKKIIKIINNENEDFRKKIIIKRNL